MLEQLYSVDIKKYFDDHCHISYFIISLLEHANTNKTPMGIAMMFSSAKYEYSDKMLTYPHSRKEIVTLENIDKIVPGFIKAILPNNQNEANEAIYIWNNRRYLYYGF
jgi:hypothetical protein